MDLQKARHMHRSQIKRESQGRERPKEWQSLRLKALQRPHSAISRNLELYVTRACNNTNNQQKCVNIEYITLARVMSPCGELRLPEPNSTTLASRTHPYNHRWDDHWADDRSDLRAAPLHGGKVVEHLVRSTPHVAHSVARSG